MKSGGKLLVICPGRTQVRSGERFADWIEIKSGLIEGQSVITEGIIKIRDGSGVTTLPPAKAATLVPETLSTS